MKTLCLISVGLCLAVTACAPKPSPELQIQLAVAQTLAAAPSATAYPTPRLLPTPTAASLAGLFCEYQFCIGHPPDVAFWDLKAQKDPLATSSFSQGILAAYAPNSLFLQLMWQDASGARDAQFMFAVIVDSKVDTESGTPVALQINNWKVFYAPIATTGIPVLPAGGAAAWVCAGRAFAWKAYTPQADIARTLLSQALQKFRCSP